MKKEDYMGVIWIILIYGYLFIVNNYVHNPQYQRILGLAGFILLFGALLGQEAYLKIKYAGYKLLKGYIPDYRLEYQFLIDNIIEQNIDGKSLTLLKLARPFNHPEYGDINQVYVNASKAFFDSLDFTPQRDALYIYGMELDHPSVAYAVLKENKVKTDHALPVPVYDLMLTDKVLTGELTPQAKTSETGNKETERYKKMYYEEHQKVIRLEEENVGLREEVQALLKSKMDFNKQVVEGILAYREAYGDLLSAAKNLTGRIPSLGVKEFTSLIIAALVIVFVWRNPQYIMWFVSHPLQTFIVLAGLALVGYAVYKKR